jgi:two-component system CheB/CheR fusion protein
VTDNPHPQRRKSDQDAAAPSSPGFPIVGIGSSAGGLEALEEFLQNLPDDTGMAFVVITHYPSGHTSLLPELLSRQTAMTVVEATDGMKLEPNHVYISPPGGRLTILNGTLLRMEPGNEKTAHLPIDAFFRSLAQDQRERAICIVLSGTGTDGTLGMKAIKGESGMAMVEEPQSAKYAGMPASAIATGLADYVLPPAAMPKELIAYAQGPYLTGAAAQSREIAAEPLQKIFVLLRNHTGHDFSAYKNTTIRRRIERRMNVQQIKHVNHYVRYLQDNPQELDILFKELLISVTNFFRDAEAWDTLIPFLKERIQSKLDYDFLRVWVPGCATGEEAYSLAIVLHECMNALKRTLDIQIFATDLDQEAIKTARVGKYPDGIAVDISPQRLDRYFIHEDNGYRIRKEIREKVVFAPQNMIKDPPFTKLDLLSCRNLLIYLNADLQKKLVPLFHYALQPDGLLFLGSSETVGALTDLFKPLDKQWKIFRRQESAHALHTLPMPTPPMNRDPGHPSMSKTPAFREAHIATAIEHALLNRFAPPSIVVNDRGDIVYIHGRTGAYLEPAQGEPRNNVLAMAREGLCIELASALQECVAQGADITRTDIQVKTNGERLCIDLTVAKVHEPEAIRGLLLITFRMTPSAPPESAKAKRSPRKSADAKRIEQLERELQYLKESRQTTQEELETSNEELKSTNEELQSTNEELQSTNEELETSKEEMQSLNEELTTVNSELQSKVSELSQANDDMQNLLNSTHIATVFLDNELNIKRFTEQAKQLVMLRQTDVGRPISDLALNLKIDDLAAYCRETLKTLISSEIEIISRNGGCYLMRIMPYRTTENIISGIVLTFVDISRVKAVDTARAYFKSIVDTVRGPLMVLNQDLRVVSANQAFYRTFDTTAQRTEGEWIYELGRGQWDIPKLRELLEEILPKNTCFEDYPVTVEFPKRGRHTFLLNARRLEQAESEEHLILLAMEDVTTQASPE